MSFEAEIAKNGNYHDADVENTSDSWKWPRICNKQQNPQQQEVEEVSIQEEHNPEVTEDGVAAIADDEDGE